MTRRDDVGEILEGDGAEDTLVDASGDNTGDAGDHYRGSVLFGVTAAEQALGQSLDQRIAEEEPDPGDTEAEIPAGDDRRTRREIAELISGADVSHSRTDPDLVGRDVGDWGLSAEEAALHLTQLPPAPPME
ncbi:MAG TPA: hypothetical protein VIQ02_19115 [Jiangellaceae bacterium]|jgi:hypothetical protein